MQFVTILVTKNFLKKMVIKISTKEKDIRVRLYEEEKLKWRDFVYGSKGKFNGVSQLVRFCVNSYIEGDFIEKGEQNTKEQESLRINDNKLEKIEELLESKLNAMKNQFQKERNDEKKIIGSEQIKGKILKMLKKANYTSEEIADFLDLEETDLLTPLKELVKQELIGYNDKMEYFRRY